MMILRCVFLIILLTMPDSFLCRASKYSIPDLSASHLIFGKPLLSSFNKESLKVFVWNIYKGQKENWSKDFSQLAPTADLLLIQEGYLDPIFQNILNFLSNYQFDFGISFIYQEQGNIPTGTTLGSKVPPTHSGLLRSKDLEPVINTPKTITFGYYPMEGIKEKVLVLNIHALNFTAQEPFERQINEACEVIGSHSGPVIFAGDFNTRTKSRLQFLREKMSYYGLKELAFLDDDRMSFMGNPLDHVFVRNFIANDARVLPFIESSDHKPLFIELTLEQSSR